MMKARVEITKEEAQKVIFTQMNEDLIEYVFETALYNDFNEDGSSDYHNCTRSEMVEKLSEETKWSLVFKTDEENNVVFVELDWKNEISGFGTCFWGHEPYPIEFSETHQYPVLKLIKEGYKEVIEE